MLILDGFYKCEKEFSQKVYLRQPLEGKWNNFTWGEVGREARTLATAIKKLNLPPKSHIILLSKNCAHWIISEVAIWMAGHISVPIYPTLSAESIKYIIEHCDAKLVIVGKLDDWSRQMEGVPKTIPSVSFPYWQNIGTTSWKEFIGNSTPMTENTKTTDNEIATIIYTSGTTGKPKGVVHTFKSMSSHFKIAKEVFGLTKDERFFSYLPLCHVAERILVEVGSFFTGGEISFAESLDTFKDNLCVAKPTIFLAVPRIWLKFQQGILQKLPQKKLDILLMIPFLNTVIKKKIKAGLGLSEVKYFVTGASAISKDLLEWFDKIDIKIQEVYGMTENFAITTCNVPGKIKFGTVGVAWSNTELKVSESGEILSRSEANMVGYYKQDEETNKTIDSEGWLHSGDLGVIDKNGHLSITGRLKDLFKTSKGKYVAPTHIEGHFCMTNLVEQVCVIGNGLPQPLAVVVLSDEGKKLDQTRLKDELKTVMKEVNNRIENYEQLNNIVILKDNWTVENGMLTPTLKIKRNVIENCYEKSMEKWVSSKDPVLFQ